MTTKPFPQDMSPEEFREAGYALVDQISEFLDSLSNRPITRSNSPEELREMIGSGSMPARGTPAGELLNDVSQLLFDHSLHNGHPRFFGYITGSAAPLGMLADMLAASINPNISIWEISPAASEIETQSVRWLAELVGYPTDGDGITVSGGNMANILGFFAARTAKAPWNIRDGGLYADTRRMTVYASNETHTWIQKATDISGLGTGAIRWIDTDDEQRIRIDDLERCIKADREEGFLPFLVIGTAGNVSTGAIDPLVQLAKICKAHDLWFHIDGAYGAPAAVLPDAPADLKSLSLADSLALDPHKWLYVPIEAAVTLVRDPDALTNAFSFQPNYYAANLSSTNRGRDYYARGLQNSRGFRALKVWLVLRQAGRDGIVESIRSNIELAERLFDRAGQHAELQASTCNLSLTTLRFVPEDLQPDGGAVDEYLDELNQRLLLALQQGGEVFVSNAIVGSRYMLRACVVNFRTTADDIDALPEIIVRQGRSIDAEMRPATLRHL